MRGRLRGPRGRCTSVATTSPSWSAGTSASRRRRARPARPGPRSSRSAHRMSLPGGCEWPEGAMDWGPVRRSLKSLGESVDSPRRDPTMARMRVGTLLLALCLATTVCLGAQRGRRLARSCSCARCADPPRSAPSAADGPQPRLDDGRRQARSGSPSRSGRPTSRLLRIADGGKNDLGDGFQLRRTHLPVPARPSLSAGAPGHRHVPPGVERRHPAATGGTAAAKTVGRDNQSQLANRVQRATLRAEGAGGIRSPPGRATKWYPHERGEAATPAILPPGRHGRGDQRAGRRTCAIPRFCEVAGASGDRATANCGEQLPARRGRARTARAGRRHGTLPVDALRAGVRRRPRGDDHSRARPPAAVRVRQASGPATGS